MLPPRPRTRLVFADPGLVPSALPLVSSHTAVSGLLHVHTGLVSPGGLFAALWGFLLTLHDKVSQTGVRGRAPLAREDFLIRRIVDSPRILPPGAPPGVPVVCLRARPLSRYGRSGVSGGLPVMRRFSRADPGSMPPGPAPFPLFLPAAPASADGQAARAAPAPSWGPLPGRLAAAVGGSGALLFPPIVSLNLGHRDSVCPHWP